MKFPARLMVTALFGIAVCASSLPAATFSAEGNDQSSQTIPKIESSPLEITFDPLKVSGLPLLESGDKRITITQKQTPEEEGDYTTEWQLPVLIEASGASESNPVTVLLKSRLQGFHGGKWHDIREKGTGTRDQTIKVVVKSPSTTESLKWGPVTRELYVQHPEKNLPMRYVVWYVPVPRDSDAITSIKPQAPGAADATKTKIKMTQTRAKPTPVPTSPATPATTSSKK